MKLFRLLPALGLVLTLTASCASSEQSYYSGLTDHQLVLEFFGSDARVEYTSERPAVNLNCPAWPRPLITACQAVSQKVNTTLPTRKGRATSIYCPRDTCGEIRFIPPEIVLLTELRYLGLEAVGLEALPPEIGQLTEL